MHGKAVVFAGTDRTIDAEFYRRLDAVRASCDRLCAGRPAAAGNPDACRATDPDGALRKGTTCEWSIVDCGSSHAPSAQGLPNNGAAGPCPNGQPHECTDEASSSAHEPGRRVDEVPDTVLAGCPNLRRR